MVLFHPLRLLAPSSRITEYLLSSTQMPAWGAHVSSMACSLNLPLTLLSGTETPTVEQSAFFSALGNQHHTASTLWMRAEKSEAEVTFVAPTATILISIIGCWFGACKTSQSKYSNAANGSSGRVRVSECTPLIRGKRGRPMNAIHIESCEINQAQPS